MKTYLEISISGTEQQQEMLIPTMIELGCEGFEQTNSFLICYIDKSRLAGDSQLFQNKLQKLIQDISSNAVIHIKEIEETNWNAEWEKTIQPIKIGQRFVIKPSWSTYHNANNRLIIEIDPKMSFGTGYHETTRLTLKLLEGYIQSGSIIIDVGTGTGILAIAAIKLGAAHAVGIDNDDWSIENAVENIQLNHVSSFVEINKKELYEFKTNQFDLITANLTLNTNIQMLGQFNRILKNNGIILLSGLLQTDEAEMLAQLKNYAFQVVEIISENEWIAISAKNSK
ncbi:MAG: 50S ribosomal protein L11 methyltransferase [Ignavibacteriales bacterium]|nr:50S ribosomal protein L11 methyltransferase [Ignavibacteriales bacterium]